jgi:dienelactone hydrolase
MKPEEIKAALLIAMLASSIAVIISMFAIGEASIGLFYILFTVCFLGVNILFSFAAGFFNKRKRRVSGIVAGILIGIMNFVAACGISTYYLQEKMFFYPSNSVQCFNILKSEKEFQEVSITARDGTPLKGWIRFNTEKKSAPLVLYFGGNGQNSSKTLYDFSTKGTFSSFTDYNVMMVDYRGYGYSGGTPSDAAMFSDALDVYDYAVKQPYTDKNRVIPIGYSIGTGVATYLASQRQTAGLVLVAPYYDGQSLCNSMLNIFHGPLSLLVRYKFDTKSFAPMVKAAPLIFTSKTDSVISFQQSEMLAQKFKSVYKFVYITGTDHDQYFSQKQTLEEIKSYLSFVAGGTQK